jgi:hypothetical protein
MTRASLNEAIALTTNPRIARILSLCTGSGHFASGVWRTDIALSAASKKAGRTAHKVVHVTREMRVGVEYRNLSQNVGVETGELPDWQEWAIYPFVLRHKDNGTEYLRINMSDKMEKVETKYYLDNVECDRGELEQYMTPGAWQKLIEKPKGGPTLTIQKKVNEILEINGERV